MTIFKKIQMIQLTKQSNNPNYKNGMNSNYKWKQIKTSHVAGFVWFLLNKMLFLLIPIWLKLRSSCLKRLDRLWIREGQMIKAFRVSWFIRNALRCRLKASLSGLNQKVVFKRYLKKRKDICMQLRRKLSCDYLMNKSSLNYYKNKFTD